MRNLILTITLTLAILTCAVVSPSVLFVQGNLTSPEVEFIIGPQAPLTNSWFDQTQIARAKVHGEAFPADPPSPLTDQYILTHYYDLGLTEYIAYYRTGDPVFLSYARKVTDSWWKCDFVKQGTLRNFDSAGTAPRHAGIGGLILRAIDGRPEMWDWINAYTRYHFDLWLKRRVNDPTLYYGVREGAFMLHYATWLAKVHPDPVIRAQYLADVENLSVNYFGRLQFPDGSWRWDDPDFIDTDGGQLKGITQPFMIGLLLNALIDVHRLSTNTAVRANVQNQILTGCRHLYSGGPYRKDEPVPVDPSKRWRAFWYFYHGGTTVNPTRYEKGGGSEPGTQLWHVSNERQATSTIFSAYAYAYLLSGDPFFKTAGDELVDATFIGSDGLRGFADDTAKSYNQTYRMGGRYFGWLLDPSSAPSPTATPTITPLPSPTPTSTPSPTPTVTPTPSPSPVASPSPTPSPLPICSKNEIIGNPPRCLCLGRVTGSGKCQTRP